jgi:hypothetical protein
VRPVLFYCEVRKVDDDRITVIIRLKILIISQFYKTPQSGTQINSTVTLPTVVCVCVCCVCVCVCLFVCMYVGLCVYVKHEPLVSGTNTDNKMFTTQIYTLLKDGARTTMHLIIYTGHLPLG